MWYNVRYEKGGGPLSTQLLGRESVGRAMEFQGSLQGISTDLSEFKFY